MAKINTAKSPSRGALVHCWLVMSMLAPIGAFAVNSTNTPSIEILYGAYEIVGRLPGVSNKPYRGWMRLAVEDDKLSIDRCIAGQSDEGEGILTDTVPGGSGLAAIEINYLQRGNSLKAICAYQNDFENLPRFSCHTHLTSNPKPEVPGLESAYPIVWPVPLDYFNCL